MDEDVAAVVVDAGDIAHRGEVFDSLRRLMVRLPCCLLGWIVLRTHPVGVVLSCCANVIVLWFLESGVGEKKRPYLYTTPPKAFQSETVDAGW